MPKPCVLVSLRMRSTSVRLRINRSSGSDERDNNSSSVSRCCGVQYARYARPAAEVSIKQMTNKPPTENSRGLRLGNLAQIRDVWMEEIEQLLAEISAINAELLARRELR